MSGLVSILDFLNVSFGEPAGLAIESAAHPSRVADLTIVDLKAEREITGDWLASKCGWSPFEGTRVTGWPMMTWIRGRAVMRDGELQGPPAGRPVRFQDVMPDSGAEA